eukprot:m51a1_g1989 hypothetical protein (1314) ;mRNA; f:1186841-1191912
MAEPASTDGSGEASTGAPAPSSPSPAPAGGEYDAEAVARWLLRKDYVLTALELYQETLEAGLAMPSVRESLRGLLDPSQQQTASGPAADTGTGGSDEGMSSSEAGAASRRTATRQRRDSSSSGCAPSMAAHHRDKEKDERIALLEYELKIAKEDLDDATKQINQLKKAASPAAPAAAPVAAPQPQQQQPQNADSESTNKPMTVEESRAIHHIIKQHLLANRLNLTAITLVEDLRKQDPDAWASAPAAVPELLSVYRQHVQRELFVPSGFKERVESLQRECTVLQAALREKDAALTQTRADKTSLSAQAQELAAQLDAAKAAAELEKAKSAAVLAQAVAERDKARSSRAPFWKKTEEPAAAATTPAPAEALAPAEKPMPSPRAVSPAESALPPKPATPEAREAAAKALEAESTWQSQFRVSRRERNTVVLRGRRAGAFETRASQAAKGAAASDDDPNAAVRVVAECLPRIVPGVVFNKREELTPLFLCAARMHPDADIRRSLARLFFNLVKRPDEAQRAVIVEGVTALAALVGPSRTSEELIGEFRQDASAKQEERRVLVADACGALAPYTSPDVREAVLLATLLNMAQDKNAVVRAAAVRNLAVLLTYFGDAEAKYAQVQEALGKLLNDPEDVVIAAVRQKMFPAMVDWADVSMLLHAKLVPFLLKLITSFLAQQAYRQADFTLQAMRIDSFDSSSATLSVSLYTLVRTSTNASRLAALISRTSGIDVGGGDFDVSVESLALGNGSFGKARVGGKHAEPLVLHVRAAGLSQKVQAVVVKFARGERVRAEVVVRRMRIGCCAPVSVEHKFGASLKSDGVVMSEVEEKDRDECAPRDENARLLELFMGCIESAIPQLSDAVFLSIPNVSAPPTVAVGGAMGPDERAVLRQALDSAIAAHNGEGYPSDLVEWLAATFVPAVLDAALLMPTPGCLPMRALGSVVCALVRDLGTQTASAVVQPPVVARMTAADATPEARSRLLVFYAAAVLPVLPDDVVMKFARSMINNVALAQNSWTSSHIDPLKISFGLLCSRKNGRQEAILPVLWELVVSPLPKVRACVAQLLAAVVPALSPADIGSRVVPGLASLHSDPDASVRAAVCSAYAAVLVSPVEQAFVDKAAVALEALADDRTASVRVSLCKAFSAIIQDAKPQLIERFVLPKLSLMAAAGLQLKDAERAELAGAVWETFRRFQGISLSGAAVMNFFIPGIKKILEAGPMLDPAVRQSAEGKLQQLESALKDISPSSAALPAPGSVPAIGGSASGAPSASAVAAARTSVDLGSQPQPQPPSPKKPLPPPVPGPLVNTKNLFDIFRPKH